MTQKIATDAHAYFDSCFVSSRGSLHPHYIPVTSHLHPSYIPFTSPLHPTYISLHLIVSLPILLLPVRDGMMVEV